MTVETLGELKTFVETQATRPDIDSGDFVTLVESMIARDVRAMELVTSVTIDESDRSSAGVYSLPADYLGMRAIYNDSSTQALNLVSLPELRSITASSTPQYAAAYGYKLEIRGVPATDSTFTLIYYQRPTALSGDSSTNTLLQNYPDLYIHAMLHWLYSRTQDLELSKTEYSLYEEAVESINSLATEQRGGARVPLSVQTFTSGAM